MILLVIFAWSQQWNRDAASSDESVRKVSTRNGKWISSISHEMGQQACSSLHFPLRSAHINCWNIWRMQKTNLQMENGNREKICPVGLLWLNCNGESNEYRIQCYCQPSSKRSCFLIIRMVWIHFVSMKRRRLDPLTRQTRKISPINLRRMHFVLNKLSSSIKLMMDSNYFHISMPAYASLCQSRHHGCANESSQSGINIIVWFLSHFVDRICIRTCTFL